MFAYCFIESSFWFSEVVLIFKGSSKNNEDVYYLFLSTEVILYFENLMILLFSKLSFPDAHNYLQIDS